MKYRPDIDGLRTVAILPVVTFHAGLQPTGGFVGVDIFFVISGFLITGVIHSKVVSGEFRLSDFYARRVRRLFPAYSVVLAASMIWAAAFMFAPDFDDFAKSALASILYISNIYFYSSIDYFTRAAELKPLLHTWSLGVEEQFYLVAPFLLMALVWLAPRWRLWVLAALIGLSFAFCVWLTGRNDALAFYMMPTRAWQLGLGGLLAISGATTVARPGWLNTAVAVAGAMMLVWAFATYSAATPFPGSAAALPTLGALALLWSGGVPGLTRRVLSVPALVFIGKISYPLYLWHWPIIVAWNYGRLDAPGPIDAVAVIALSFLAAWATWKFVETPVRTGRVLAQPRALGLAYVAISAGMALPLLAVWSSGGWPERHPPELIALINDDDLMPDRRECHFQPHQRYGDHPLCQRGAQGRPPSFVLVGDSHAEAAASGLFAAAETAGLSGWQFTSAGFNPLPGRYRQGGQPDPMIRPFMAFLKEDPSIRSVVMTGFWMLQIAGESYRHDPTVFIDGDYDGSGIAYNRVSFAAAMDRLVSAFPDRHFILLDDIPSGDDLYLEAFARKSLRHSDVPDHLPRAAEQAQRAIYEPVMRDLAARHDNVDYMPVFEALCKDQSCPLFDGSGMALYRDGDHLSRRGALSLTETFAPVMSRIAAGSGVEQTMR